MSRSRKDNGSIGFSLLIILVTILLCVAFVGEIIFIFCEEPAMLVEELCNEWVRLERSFLDHLTN